MGSWDVGSICGLGLEPCRTTRLALRLLAMCASLFVCSARAYSPTRKGVLTYLLVCSAAEADSEDLYSGYHEHSRPYLREAQLANYRLKQRC